jgi:hypothetical protein
MRLLLFAQLLIGTPLPGSSPRQFVEPFRYRPEALWISGHLVLANVDPVGRVTMGASAAFAGVIVDTSSVSACAGLSCASAVVLLLRVAPSPLRSVLKDVGVYCVALRFVDEDCPQLRHKPSGKAANKSGPRSSRPIAFESGVLIGQILSLLVLCCLTVGCDLRKRIGGQARLQAAAHRPAAAIDPSISSALDPGPARRAQRRPGSDDLAATFSGTIAGRGELCGTFAVSGVAGRPVTLHRR